MHAGDVQVKILSRRLAEGVEPSEARAGGASARAAGVENRHARTRLRQPIRYVRADHASADDDSFHGTEHTSDRPVWDVHLQLCRLAPAGCLTVDLLNFPQPVRKDDTCLTANAP